MDLDPLASNVQKGARWLLVWSIVVLTCGIFAILLPLTFSFAIAVVIGCLVLVAGVAHLVFAFHTRSLGGFLLHILLCVIYEIAAVCLLANPLLRHFIKSDSGDIPHPGRTAGTRHLFSNEKILPFDLGAD